MKIPRVDDPTRYRGLFVFDFGEWTAMGYTADEIATLLESEQYRSGKVYKIVRASPDGSMELRGVSPERFELESGIFHWRSDEAAARADFRDLLGIADAEPPPCRMNVQLALVPFLPSGSDSEPTPRHVTALIFPAEFDDEVGRWLMDHGYRGGDWVEGGISIVTSFRTLEKEILDRKQLWSLSSQNSRSAEEIYQSVRQAVQR